MIGCGDSIVIHCRNGRTRSPVVVAAYFVVVHCLSPEKAYEFLSMHYRRARPSADMRGIDREMRFIMHLAILIKMISPGSSIVVSKSGLL
jgi:protein-tyrosine phosphatase